MGKLFEETSLRGMVLSLGMVGSASSSLERRSRSSRRQAWVRAPEMSEGSPLRVRVSWSKDSEQDAVVRVRRSDWERVTERDELVGRLSLVSRLPQYLRLSVSPCFELRNVV